jgi:pimeloyl-ACP methyl ester carboxylesterase
MKSSRFSYVLAAVLIAAGIVGTAFYWRPLLLLEWTARAVARALGVRSGYVRLGAYRLHYLVAGRGAPLVLVHGLGGSAEDWLPLIPSLARHSFRVYAIDLLGFGRSDRPDVAYSISLQETVLKQFLDHQHLERVDLGGWSMGGWVVLKFALDYPGRVTRAFVADSAGIQFHPSFDTTLLAHPRTAGDVLRLERLLTPKPRPIPAFIVRDLLRRANRQAWVCRRALDSMMAGKDLLDGKLPAIRVPVLILWGRQDALTPPACGERMRREIPHSVLVMLQGCGHLAPLECRDRALPEILRFLSPPPAELFRPDHGGGRGDLGPNPLRGRQG